MNKLVNMIVANPLVLFWLVGGSFALGLATGFSGAWWIQGLRLDALRAEHKTFVTTIKMQGDVAKKVADLRAEENKRNKESSDRDYEKTIASLRADVKRMRSEHSRSSFVPPVPTGARRSDLACFDRVELDRTLRELDAEISDLIEEGDKNAVGLNIARSWALGQYHE
jgi:hypothetical protein